MNKPGFSLIEILMGFALVAIVFGIGGAALFSTLTSSRKAAAIALAKTEGQFAMRSMTDVIQFANGALCQNSNQRLQLTQQDGTTQTIDYVSATNPDKITLTKGGQVIDLTTDRVAVSVSLCPNGQMFNCVNAREVDICFTVDNASGIDVTDMANDTGGLMFQTGITLTNLTN
jgi:type II secretory pathway pseudopilin PulG